MDAKTTPDAYGTLIEPTTLKIQRLLPGPIERIWAYLTDSELRRKWLAAGKLTGFTQEPILNRYPEPLLAPIDNFVRNKPPDSLLQDVL